MNRKQAHQRKDLKYSFYCRNKKSEWLKDYTEEQFYWLVDHGHLEPSEPMVHYGERPDEEFMRFTKKGRRWYNWYTLTFWRWFKIFVLRVYDIRRLWQAFRIKCGHHYPWQNIENWEL